VPYDAQAIVPLRTQVRFTTLIVLPVGEQILEVTSGDKEFWVVHASQHLCTVKPARVGAQSNLNLFTASGTVYSFALNEVSTIPGAKPDLKVYVEPAEGVPGAPADGHPLFVPVQQIEEYRHQIDLARQDAARATERARLAEEAATRATAAAEGRVADATAAFRARYPLTLHFPYRFPKGIKPLQALVVFHDDRCTYLYAQTRELPALYELADGKPRLVQYEVRDGVYVVGKILDRGYLVLGRKAVRFERQESGS
jgi:type IV secretion system protein VirB9